MANPAVKKRIKLPSFRVENFCRFLYPSFLPLPQSIPSCFFFFQDLPTRSGSIYSIHRMVDRHWAARVVGLLLLFSPLLLLSPSRFRPFSCFPRAILFSFCKRLQSTIRCELSIRPPFANWKELAPLIPPIKRASHKIFGEVFLSLRNPRCSRGRNTADGTVVPFLEELMTDFKDSPYSGSFDPAIVGQD